MRFNADDNLKRFHTKYFRLGENQLSIGDFKVAQPIAMGYWSRLVERGEGSSASNWAPENLKLAGN